MPDNMVILPLTIKARMVYKALNRKALGWYKEFAADNNIDEDIIDVAVSDYNMLSARVSNLNGLADFELATVQDTPEQHRAKFEQYINSGRVPLVEMIGRRIAEMDAPDNALYAPENTAEGEA